MPTIVARGNAVANNSVLLPGPSQGRKHSLARSQATEQEGHAPRAYTPARILNRVSNSNRSPSRPIHLVIGQIGSLRISGVRAPNSFLYQTVLTGTKSLGRQARDGDDALDQFQIKREGLSKTPLNPRHLVQKTGGRSGQSILDRVVVAINAGQLYRRSIELSTIEPTTNPAAAAAQCNCERLIIASNRSLTIDRQWPI